MLLISGSNAYVPTVSGLSACLGRFVHLSEDVNVMAIVTLVTAYRGVSNTSFITSSMFSLAPNSSFTAGNCLENEFIYSCTRAGNWLFNLRLRMV